MEVDEIQTQVTKFQRLSSSSNDNSSNPNKIATQNDDVSRLCGWPSSRIVRVSRASGGKDRHSKVLTSKGLRDRRVRLSVTTAIQFYDLQDRLGYDQPSKAVEWLIKAASSSIAELPSLDASFTGDFLAGKNGEFQDPSYQNASVSKSSACSSTSETSKGSGLSLSRSENRIKARERARSMAAKKEKEKEKEKESVNGVEQSSSFTDLLTGGGANPAMDYFFSRQFNVSGAGSGEDGQHTQQQQFSFLQENFNVSSSSSSPGFNRGTLQSNLSSILPHHNHNQHFQRFHQSSSMADGSTSLANFPFFAAPEHFPASGYDSQRWQLYGGDGGGRHSDHHKEKSKN